MVSFQAFEVEALIVPSFVIFLLFIVPFPLVSKLVAKLVLKIESIQVSGVSLLLLATIGTFGLFVNQTYTTHKKYGTNAEVPAFVDLAAKLDHQGKKWKSERDLYIHAVTFILLAAITKFARLIRDAHKNAASSAKNVPASPSTKNEKKLA